MSDTAFHHVRCRPEHGVLVLTIAEKQVQGDDLADALRQEFFEALDRFGAKRVVLDFREVHYLGSPGFRPLLSLYRRLHSAGGAMVLCNLEPEVAEVFHVTRLISTTRSFVAPFDTAPTLDDALARLRHFTPSRVQDVLVLALGDARLQEGEAFDSLRKDLRATLAQAGTGKLVLDLGQVESITPGAAQGLESALAQLREAGTRTVLCRLRPQPAEALRPSALATAPDVTSAAALLST